MTDRIAFMQAIKSSSGGFARLYGSKDLAQFCAQIEYMRDFTLEEPQRDIPFTETMPTYADMSTAQLRRYFTWRTGVRQGVWEEIPYSYALVYLFELMNFPGNAAQIAEAWLRLREHHPKLDMRMPAWFKDYCLCYDLDFHGQISALGLAEFYPKARGESLCDIASYNCRESRFFRENPEQLPLLEQAAQAVLRNLEPLFAFYNLSPEAMFFPRPARFAYYEPFRGAAVLAPEQAGAREVMLARDEIYCLRGGKWSRCADNAFRPPSHAAGWLVKRTEAVLRSHAGFAAPWSDPEGRDLMERWLHNESGNAAAAELLRDPRLAQFTEEAARAVCEHRLEEGGLIPEALSLARAINEEPFKTIRALRNVRGGEKTVFLKQGKMLAALSDAFGKPVPCAAASPDYAALSQGELRSYLTWRTQYRAGNIHRTDSGYASLYARELLAGIGTNDAFAALCEFLREYGPLDRVFARRLPDMILQCYGRQDEAALQEKLCQHHVEAWFPALFLFTDANQFELFCKLSPYKPGSSRFPARADCFDEVLGAANRAFAAECFGLRRLMVDPHGELTTFAGAVAAFLLKRMEQRLRERTRFPYHIHADPARMLGKATQHKPRLHAFVCSPALPEAVDRAVDEFAREHELPVYEAPPPRPRSGARGSAPVIRPEEPPPPPPPPVKIDFSQLEHIRREANEMTELLIVEEEDELTMQNAECRNEETVVIDSSSLHEALTIEQISIVDYLVTGQGAPPPMDEIAIEAINEIALDVIGDTLIEADEDGRAFVFEEYAQQWKDGVL